MSSIAHTYLRSQAPALLAYEVGFQILDKNKESTKVVGITGFKIGDQWLYAPVFFLNGKVEGQELLYDKNRDQFVPLKENWVNSFVKRRPSVLGEPHRKGGDNNNSFRPSSPDFRTMFQTPKIASAHPGMRAGVAAFAHFASTDPFTDEKYAGVCDLKGFLKKEGAAVIGALVRNLEQHPTLAQAFHDRFGGLEILDEAVKEAKARNLRGGVLASVKSAAVKKSEDVRVYLREDFEVAPIELSDPDKERLLDKAIVIQDDRPDAAVTKAYEDGAKSVANPTTTGIYPVLMDDGNFRRCFVGLETKDADGPCGEALVIPIDDPLTTDSFAVDKIYVQEGEVEDWRSWWKGLSNVSASTLRENGDYHYALIGEGGCSAPFDVSRSRDNGDSDGLEVNFDYIGNGRRGGNFPLARHEKDCLRGGGDRLEISPKGIKFRGEYGVLFVPDDFKALKVREPYNWDEDNNQKRKERVRLGTTRELNKLIFEKCSAVHVLKLGASSYMIDGRPLDSRDALVHLVVDHRLREKAAAAILDRATVSGPKRFWVEKLASNYPLQDSAPSAPSFPNQAPQYSDSHGHVIEPSYEDSAQMDLARSTAAPMPDGIDDQTAQTASQAAQTGQREVFDTTLIASTLKSVRDDSMIDRYIPDLFKGMDRVGRIYFSMCWHGDVFQRRYGRQDMSELKDGLRNTFEHMGDTILFLQQKTVEPYRDEFSADLADVAT